MNYTIYCDNDTEYRWFANLSSRLSDAKKEVIGPRGTNPPAIDNLVRYDRPDIILVDENETPVLVAERTREVPTGHNVGQRVARCVRAAELGVPFLKMMPFDAMKHGVFAGRCGLNPRILECFERMWQIHRSPVLAVKWPVDQHYELIDDGSENMEISTLVDAYLRTGHDPSIPEFGFVRHHNRTEVQLRTSMFARYGAPPPSVSIVKTADFISQYSALVELPKVDETVVYTIAMTPRACRREDPYTGTQFIYDYAYCRSGVRPEDKFRNLVLHFPKLTKTVFLKNNPFDPDRKSSNWYLTANAMLFKDGAEILR